MRIETTLYLLQWISFKFLQQIKPSYNLINIQKMFGPQTLPNHTCYRKLYFTQFVQNSLSFNMDIIFLTSWSLLEAKKPSEARNCMKKSCYVSAAGKATQILEQDRSNFFQIKIIVILDYDTKIISSNSEPLDLWIVKWKIWFHSASYKQCAGWAFFHRDPIMILYMAQATKVRKVAQSLLSSS